MFRGFSLQHGEILQELLAETAGSLVIKTDPTGFIEQASAGLEQIGVRLSEMLFRPHLADLTTSCHADALRTYHGDVIAGVSQISRLEFPLSLGLEEPIWFALSLRRLADEEEEGQGALGLLRSVEGRRGLEDELSNIAMTDTTTGLANTKAFKAMLAFALRNDSNGVVAVLELDRFSALKLRFGLSMADEMLWAFGRFLINMFPADALIARIDGDRLAVLMTEIDTPTALARIEDALETFKQLSMQSPQTEMHLSASAGLALLTGAAERVMMQAERALVVARALGGCRAELQPNTPRWTADRQK